MPNYRSNYRVNDISLKVNHLTPFTRGEGRQNQLIDSFAVKLHVCISVRELGPTYMVTVDTPVLPPVMAIDAVGRRDVATRNPRETDVTFPTGAVYGEIVNLPKWIVIKGKIDLGDH